jgi:ketosteroid isomerase-like protein
MATVADRFMRAVQRFEDSDDLDPLLDLFAEDAEALNLGRTESARGGEEVRGFWLDYRAMFRRVHSEFTNVIEGEHGAVLEWISRGALASGEPVTYKGVSVLETDGHLIRRFRTYYDSAVFLPGGAKQEG